MELYSVSPKILFPDEAKLGENEILLKGYNIFYYIMKYRCYLTFHVNVLPDTYLLKYPTL